MRIRLQFPLGILIRLKCFQIKDLEDLLQEKSENCSDVEAARNRIDTELKLQQSTNCELRDVIRHLETDLDARCKTVRQQEQVCQCYIQMYMLLVETIEALFHSSTSLYDSIYSSVCYSTFIPMFDDA